MVEAVRDGDSDRIGGTGECPGDRAHQRGPMAGYGHRPKIVGVLVAATIVVLTVVLCCAAIGQAASLLDVDADHFW